MTSATSASSRLQLRGSGRMYRFVRMPLKNVPFRGDKPANNGDNRRNSCVANSFPEESRP